MARGMDPGAFKVYLGAIGALALNLWLLTTLTGVYRNLKKEYVIPEDAKAIKGTVVESEKGMVARVKRAHANAIENLLPFVGESAERLGARAHAEHGPAILLAQPRHDACADERALSRT